jgi:putative spermidine/putrescine transport system substrate-binding protein
MKTWTVPALFAAVTLAAVLFLGFLFLSHAKPVLTVATWPESYGHAQAAAQIMPFGAKSGTDARLALYNGGTRELAEQVASKHYDWDAVDMELPDAVAACQSGLLEKIDASTLPAAPDGTPAAQDFVPGAIGPCWVASTVYSQVIVVTPPRVVGNTTVAAPKTLADFFDVKRFPGKRALPRANAKLNVEMALLADGVAAKDVYDVLSSSARRGAGAEEARYATRQSRLVRQCERCRCDGKGRARDDGLAAQLGGVRFRYADARYRRRPRHHLGPPALPARSVRRSKGQSQRCQARWTSCASPPAPKTSARWQAGSPMARRGGALCPSSRNQPELHIAMTPYLPTAHFDTAFAVDAGWWRLHGADVAGLWQEWLTKSDPH